MKNEIARREIESLDYYLQNHTNDYSEESHTAMMMAIKALKQEPCEDCVRRQEVLDILKDKWNMFSDANDAMQESINAIKALQPVTPLPQPFDLEGLKSDLKALNCGFPYGLDYLLDCLNRRLGITIIEADKAEGSKRNERKDQEEDDDT